MADPKVSNKPANNARAHASCDIIDSMNELTDYESKWVLRLIDYLGKIRDDLRSPA